MIEQTTLEKRTEWECFKHKLEADFKVHKKILSPPYWNNDDYDVFTTLYNLKPDYDNETFFNFEQLKKELNARRYSENSVKFTDDSIINALIRLQGYGNIECCSDLNEINLRIQVMK
ncbi:MAG TPA: hypothetical protein VGK38_01835 [Prolixibacteraceae bacterium]|jgi:hypothetical protein